MDEKLLNYIKVYAPHNCLDVVAVDVQDGARQRLGDIRAVGAAPRLPRVGGEGDLQHAASTARFEPQEQGWS